MHIACPAPCTYTSQSIATDVVAQPRRYVLFREQHLNDLSSTVTTVSLLQCKAFSCHSHLHVLMSQSIHRKPADA